MADAGLSDADVAAMNKGWFETMTAVRDKLRAVGKVRSAYLCGCVVGCLRIRIRICICCGCLCLRRRLRLLPAAWPVLVPRSSSARLKCPHEHASSPSPAAALSAAAVDVSSQNSLCCAQFQAEWANCPYTPNNTRYCWVRRTRSLAEV